MVVPSKPERKTLPSPPVNVSEKSTALGKHFLLNGDDDSLALKKKKREMNQERLSIWIGEKLIWTDSYWG